MTTGAYSHRALFYDSDDELVAELVPFVTDGVDRDERVVVVVNSSVGDTLRQHVGPSAEFELVDSADVYTFPVRTLAGYVDTVASSTEHGRAIRVAGEPIWFERSPLEVAEWSCVEAACNVVFAESRLQMLCPYNTAKLEPSIIEVARRTHPEIQYGSTVEKSDDFSPFAHQASVRRSQLPHMPQSFEHMWIVSSADVAAASAFVEGFVTAQKMAQARHADVLLAVQELVTLGIDFGRGPAQIRLWTTTQDLICEMQSSGSPTSPFAGYLPPSASTTTDDGLWLAGQHCDLVAVRDHDGTTIRMHFSDYLVASRPDCHGVDTLLGAFALQSCDPVETVLVNAHLAECADCRAELARLAKVVGMMGDADRHAEGDW